MYLSLPTLTELFGVGRMFESVCLFVCTEHNSKKIVFRVGVGNEVGIS